MKICQYQWENKSWNPPLPNGRLVDWLLLFGSVPSEELLLNLQEVFPKALMTGCSTAGEIISDMVIDKGLTLTTITFEKATSVRGCQLYIQDPKDSFAVGQNLAMQLLDESLKHVFVLSEGLNINGSNLVAGLSDFLPDNVLVTGGLSGDDGEFQLTKQYFNGKQDKNTVIAIVVYGSQFSVSHGSVGGWHAFGPERMVTKSASNILYEIDNMPALDLYKRYLGEYAKELPSSALRFPLKISGEGVNGNELVRTILGINEEEKSLTFAGNIPEGCQAQLMMASYEDLVEGAQLAAEQCVALNHHPASELAILISCVGRKILLQQHVDDEVEVVRQALGKSICMTGFYSYGEISPALPSQVVLHNQTMTITTFFEGS